MNYKAYQNCEFDKAYAMAKTRMDVESNKLCAGHPHTCTIGCMFDGYAPRLSVEYYNIYPRGLYTLEALFEGLPTKEEQDQFHIDYYDAIPIGGDTRRAWHNYMSQLMLDPKNGMTVHDTSGSAVKVGLLYIRAASGDMPSDFEWEKAEARAEWAGGTTAWAELTARLAARTAASAAGSFSKIATAAGMEGRTIEKIARLAASAGGAPLGALHKATLLLQNHYRWQRDTLLQCLRDC